jgi:putative glutamine amidotransferase
VKGIHLTSEARAHIAIAPRRFGGDATAMGAWRCNQLFVEHALSNVITEAGGLVVGAALPGAHRAAQTAAHYANLCDGLVLQGGTDIDAAHSGAISLAEPDRDRDTFELALIRAFVAVDKPILALCRGMQLLNIAYGGTLETLTAACAAHHSDPQRYADHDHSVELAASGYLARLYGIQAGEVNSAHRQAVLRLGHGLVVEAIDPSDARVEAIRSSHHRFVLGVQWHPEFQRGDDHRLDGGLLIRDFVSHAARVHR